MSGGEGVGGVADLDSLRKTLLADHTVKAEERVEVNQRHLIDKILARYSAEHTIYREVLQNANDALATSLEVIFEEVEGGEGENDCSPPNDSPDASPRPLSQILIRNNGRPFDQDDWKRLGRIAEGNPDEQKIGFFGVGFYSLFSICEEPFVVSGGKCLAFYWKGDQLYARPGPAPASFDPKWTVIFLKLREPLCRPHLDRFGNFLVKSILFTENLECLSVYSRVAGLLLKVSKKRSPTAGLSIKPSSLLSSLSSKPRGLFTLKESKTCAIQIDLDKRYVSLPEQGERNILSSLWSFARNMTKSKERLGQEEALLRPGIFSLFLHVITNEAKTVSSSAFSSAMERIIKKNPARSIRLAMIYCSYDEFVAASGRSNLKEHPILGSVIPNADEGGKVFIGFETHQTVGCALHVAGPFIPTVERESLDFVDPTLAAWNEELLRLAAKIARVLYEIEMVSLGQLYQLGEDGEMPDSYWERARYILRSFGFQGSSPSPAPANLLLHEFFSSTKQELLFPSTCGVHPISSLRIVPASILSFTRSIPSIEGGKLQGCDRMLAVASSSFEIPPVNTNEVLASLRGKRLSTEQVYDCLSWIIDLNRQGVLNMRAFYSLASCLEVPCGSHAPPHYRLLSSVTQFAPRTLWEDNPLPLPETCLSPTVSRRFMPHELSSALNLRELGVFTFVEGLLAAKSLEDVQACESLLIFLSERFSSLPQDEQGRIASVLANEPIVPTTRGLFKPGKCYLEEVGLFGDLPLVSLGERRRVSDALLISLGVLSHFEVSLIFSQLSTLEWSHRQLIKYLEKHEDQLTAAEKDQLGAAKIFPAIGIPDTKFSLSQLYLDHPVARLLNLPVLEWKPASPPSAHSPTTLFMVRLGLQPVIPWLLLFRNVEKVGQEDRILLYRYFVEHYSSDYKATFDVRKIDFACIAVARKDSLANPSQVFADEGSQALGFDVVTPELQPFARLFGVEKHPPTQQIVEKLLSRAFAPQDAPRLFAYLSTIVHNFTSRDIKQLSDAPFLPHDDGWRRPSGVYFSKGVFDWNGLFVIVDFGPAAIPFLSACGVQREPTPENIAQRLCQDQQPIFAALQVEKYLELLRWIGTQLPSISRKTLQALSVAKWLLGLEYYVVQKESERTEDSLLSSRYVLESAEKIFVVDDTISQQVFSCLAVPEANLETTYAQFGVRKLSTCVKMGWNFVGAPRPTDAAKKLAELIKTRAPLLVAEGPNAGKHQKHGAQAVKTLNHLQVATVDSISILRSFNGKNHQQPTTACLNSESLLLIAGDFDFFDVANVLVRLICSGSSRLPDALLISVLLSSSLAGLRAKGFAVDQLLSTERKTPLANEITQSTAHTESTDEPRQSHNFRKGAGGNVTTPSFRGAGENIPPSSSKGLAQSPHASTSRVSSMFGAIKQAIQGHRRQSSRHGEILKAPQDDDESLTTVNPHELKHALAAAVGGLQKSQKQAFVASARTETTVSSEATKEAESYCEIIPASALSYAGDLDGVSVYVSTQYDSASRDSPFSSHPRELHAFSKILCDLARIFGAPKGAVHIFFDERTRTIAFNRGHTLFFNLAHFIRQNQTRISELEQSASWFMTFCHELAHNFVGPHDQRHEFYMSGYAEVYLSRLFNYFSK